MSPELHVFLQRLIPQHVFTRVMGWLGNITLPWWKNWAIRRFIRKYGVDVSEALDPNPLHYRHFNAFFTRYLRTEKRLITTEPFSIASPVDGTVAECGAIQDGKLLQAKGQWYSLESLLGGQQTLASQFRLGQFATFYLAPKDYHRVHMPLEGTLTHAWYVPGDLFSVNLATAARVPGLFARNERLICQFATQFGNMVMILVGACLVASISTVWSGAIRPANRRTVSSLTIPSNLTLAKGDEMGHFCLGSTVIVLFPSQQMQWQAGLHANASVKFGQAIGTILQTTNKIVTHEAAPAATSLSHNYFS
jgi:phosphatidylserine decarboxylase